jgi:MscS family membrane protein
MRYLLFLWVFGLVFRLAAQQDSLDVDLSSPYQSIWTHLYYLQDDHYDEIRAAQPFEPQRRGMEQARELAIKFKQVLDGNGLYLYMDEIPKKKNYYDSTQKAHKYTVHDEFPNIYLLKNTRGEWTFSDASVPAIHEAHSRTFRYGTGALLKFLPKLGSKKILGLYTFQYVAILFLALLSAVIHRIFTFLAEKVIRKLLKRSGFETTAEDSLRPIARPTSLFVIVLLLLLFVPVLQLPPNYAQYVILVLRVLVPLMATIIVYRMVNVLATYFARLATQTESTLDDQMVPLVRKTLKTFVVITGTLFILDNLNIPILPLITGLSIGGLAVALAAQDTLKNFFGSLMIFIDRPFQIGDWVTSGEVDGTVEEVGFRSSRVRTFRNSLIYIPNGKLADSVIDNHGLRVYRRFYTTISVTYDTPPALMEAFTEGLRQVVQKHPNTVKDNYHIYFNDFGASSLNIMFYVFFRVPTWGEELKARHEVLLEIMKLGERKKT